MYFCTVYLHYLFLTSIKCLKQTNNDVSEEKVEAPKPNTWVPATKPTDKPSTPARTESSKVIFDEIDSEKPNLTDLEDIPSTSKGIGVTKEKEYTIQVSHVGDSTFVLWRPCNLEVVGLNPILGGGTFVLWRPCNLQVVGLNPIVGFGTFGL